MKKMNIRVQIPQKGDVRDFVSASPYLTPEGAKGWIIRPFANAWGGAHPRYMRRDDGFISLSPRLGIETEDEAIQALISCSFRAEIRQTKKGACCFLAFFDRTEEADTIPLLLTQGRDAEFNIPVKANKGATPLFVARCRDSTATSRTSVETIMVLAEEGFIVEKEFHDGDPTIYQLRCGRWVEICSDDYITADDLEDLY